MPKAARDDWARFVGDVLSSVSTSMQEIDAWCIVFMLARCILANPPRGGRLHWRDTLRLVRSQIRMWREGKFADLWEAVVSRDRAIFHRTKKKATHSTPLTASLRQSNAARARRAVEDGQYRKAMQSLTSAGVASVTEDVVSMMKEKYPSASPLSIPSDPVPPPSRVT